MGLMPTKPIILVGERWAGLMNAFRELLIVDDGDLAMLTLVRTIEEAVNVMGEPAGSERRWFG